MKLGSHATAKPQKSTCCGVREEADGRASLQAASREHRRLQATPFDGVRGGLVGG